MIDHPAFTVEPWCLRETELLTEVLAQTESVFALSNGHIGVRTIRTFSIITCSRFGQRRVPWA